MSKGNIDPLLARIADLQEELEFYYEEVDKLSEILKTCKDDSNITALHKKLNQYNYNIAKTELEIEQLEGDEDDPY